MIPFWVKVLIYLGTLYKFELVGSYSISSYYAGREAGIIKAGPGELSNSGFKEEDGQGKEDTKDENEQRQAAPAGKGKVRKSAEKSYR